MTARVPSMIGHGGGVLAAVMVALLAFGVGALSVGAAGAVDDASSAIATGDSEAGVQSEADWVGRLAAPSHQIPGDLIGVDIIERLDNQIPLELTFIDDSGVEIALAEIFDGSVPVLLQIGYNRCPMLCNLVLNELIKGLKQLDWTSPDKFRLVSVSVDETESHELASLKKRAYLLEYGRPEAASGWHFLTGPADRSRAVADAVGFGYRWVPETQEFAHAAAIMVITPDGRVSRYLYGVRFRPADLRLALLEASEGKIGSTLDRILLWCYVYDHDAGGYVLFAMRLMRLGGAVTLVLLSGALAFMWVREMRRGRGGSAPTAPASPRPTA